MNPHILPQRFDSLQSTRINPGYCRALKRKLKDKIAFININLCETEVVPFTIIHALWSAFVKSKQYTPVYLMQSIR